MRKRLLALVALVGLVAMVSVSGRAADEIQPVEITSPSNGDVVTGTIPVAITLDSSFPADVVVLRVDGKNVGFDSTAPYVINWDTSTAIKGVTHTLVARAYGTRERGAAGHGIAYQEWADSQTVSVRVNGIAITSPAQNATVQGSIVDVKATAKIEAPSIDKIELYADGVLEDTWGDVPAESTAGTDFTLKWDANDLASASAHSLVARVIYGGNTPVFEDSLPVIVRIAGARIISHSEGDVVSGVVTVQADAADTKGIVDMTLLVDNVAVDSDDSEPYEFSWDTSGLKPGSLHTLKARGNNGTADVDSALTQVFVAGVSIASPSAGLVPRTTHVEINAADVDGVDAVSLYADGVLVTTQSTVAGRPFVIDWDTSGYDNGTQVLLTASYTDGDANESAESDSVLVTVDKDLPTLSTTLEEGAVLVSAPSLPRQICDGEDPPSCTPNDVQATSEISGTVGDVGSGLGGLTVLLQGNTGSTSSGQALIDGNGWSYLVPFIQTPGEYLVTITAFDLAGNATTITRTVLLV